MPAKKITVPITPEMERSLEELCELHAYQLPTLASQLLRDALAGRRSSLLPKKRVSGHPGIAEPKSGSEHNQTPQGEKMASGGFWGENGHV